jgi:hypothetical protein
MKVVSRKRQRKQQLPQQQQQSGVMEVLWLVTVVSLLLFTLNLWTVNYDLDGE